MQITEQRKEFWVYILLCKNGSYYTGYTNNIGKRYQSHVDGSGRCKYTKSFKPVCIAQCWKIVGSKSLAMQTEQHIKKLSRIEKECIIKQPLSLSNDPRISVYGDFQAS